MIFAFSRLPAREQIELFQRCMELGVQVDIVPRLYEVIGSRMQVHDVEGLPLVGLRVPRLSRSSRLLKRSLDLMLSVALLIVFAPLLVYSALRIKLELTRAACSSGRSGWAPAAGASGSSSSGRCTWTPRSGRPSWST